MKLSIFFKKNGVRFASIFEIIIGIILLIREIYDFIMLPTTTEAEDRFGGLVDLFKYKEDTYSQLFLWSIFLFTGLSFWINRKMYWVLTQSLFILIFLKLGLDILHPISLWYPIIQSIILFLCIPFFVWLEIEINRENVLESVKIDIKIKLVGILFTLFCCCVYLHLEV